MIKIEEHKSIDGKRKAEIWQDEGWWRVFFFENEKKIHVAELSGQVKCAEILAEDFVLGEIGRAHV